MTSAQIKSKDRVRSLAEVYTNKKEVDAMLDLIPVPTRGIISYKYLEPACGNGNFLEAILERKLAELNKLTHKQKKFEQGLLRCICSIYGIDIDTSNVDETKTRLFNKTKHHFDYNLHDAIYSNGLLDSIKYVLNKNIICGNTIDKNNKILISEFTFKNSFITEKIYNFNDLASKQCKTPIYTNKPKHFLTLCNE